MPCQGQWNITRSLTTHTHTHTHMHPPVREVEPQSPLLTCGPHFMTYFQNEEYGKGGKSNFLLQNLANTALYR